VWVFGLEHQKSKAGTGTCQMKEKGKEKAKAWTRAQQDISGYPICRRLV